MKNGKYTTVSVEKTTKTMLDYLRAKTGKSLSVIMREIVGREYEREFGKGFEAEEVQTYEPEGTESGAIPIVG